MIRYKKGQIMYQSGIDECQDFCKKGKLKPDEVKIEAIDDSGQKIYCVIARCDFHRFEPSDYYGAI